MERLPGVLLYKLAKFGDISDILILECFSKKISNKLKASKSGFSAILRKALRDNALDCADRFEAYKTLAKIFVQEKPGHLLPYFDIRQNKLAIFDANSCSIVKY